MLSHTRLALVVCALAALTLGVFGSTAGARGSTTVKLLSETFSPNEKTVRSGTTVRFKWVDGKHNVVKAKGPGGDFSSGTTNNPGVNFTKKFKKSGNYKLICTIHEGMTLKLHVN